MKNIFTLRDLVLSLLVALLVLSGCAPVASEPDNYILAVAGEVGTPTNGVSDKTCDDATHDIITINGDNDTQAVINVNDLTDGDVVFVPTTQRSGEVGQTIHVKREGKKVCILQQY